MPNSTCIPARRPSTRTSSPAPSAAQSQIVCDALAALRSGQDGIEQFIEALFDELDASWDQLDHDRSWIDARREELKQAQAEAAIQRTQWETDRQQWHDSLQQRVVELERDRLRLQSELETARAGTVELTQAMTDQRRQMAAERAEWAQELRMLREALDRPAPLPAAPLPTAPPRPFRNPPVEPLDEPPNAFTETLASELPDDRPNERSDEHGPEPIVAPPAPQRPPIAASARPPAPAIPNPMASDPVLGPLLSQFERLQRDVAKRRMKTNPRS